MKSAEIRGEKRGQVGNSAGRHSASGGPVFQIPAWLLCDFLAEIKGRLTSLSFLHVFWLHFPPAGGTPCLTITPDPAAEQQNLSGQPMRLSDFCASIGAEPQN